MTISKKARREAKPIHLYAGGGRICFTTAIKQSKQYNKFRASERASAPHRRITTLAYTQKHIIPCCADYSKSMCSPLLAASLSVRRRRRRIHFAIRTLKERRRSNYRHCCQIRWQSANPLLIAAKGLLRPRLHQAAQRRIAGASLGARSTRADPAPRDTFPITAAPGFARNPLFSFAH
jgi:hypothetical protein